MGFGFLVEVETTMELKTTMRRRHLVLRKLLMATLAVVPMTGTMQCFAGELVTIVFLTVHALRQPFVTRMDNNLQTCALALVGLYLLMGPHATHWVTFMIE